MILKINKYGEEIAAVEMIETEESHMTKTSGIEEVKNNGMQQGEFGFSQCLEVNLKEPANGVLSDAHIKYIGEACIDDIISHRPGELYDEEDDPHDAVRAVLSRDIEKIIEYIDNNIDQYIDEDGNIKSN